MASEIRVDKINSLSGVGTVTLSPTGVDIAGITTAATLKATTGIVTTLTATTGIVTNFTANAVNIGIDTGVYGEDLVVTGNTRVTGITTFGDSDNPALMLNIDATSGLPAISIPDSIIHSGDTNTKIRFPAADTVSVETAGSERFNVSSAGRIRINCTSQPSATVTGIQLDGAAYNGTVRISQGGGTSGTDGAVIQVYGGQSGTGIGAAAAMGSVLNLVNTNNTDNNQNSLDFSNSNSLSIAKVIGKNDSHSGRTGSLIFSTSNSAAPTEKMRIGNEGTTTFYHNGTNHVTVSGTAYCNGVGAQPAPSSVVAAFGRDSGSNRSIHCQGHVQIASGYGIQFASSSTGAVLDDYEEGTFDPTLQNGNSGYRFQYGYYVKIGGAVHFTAFIEVSATPPSSNIAIGGLPFTSINNSNANAYVFPMLTNRTAFGTSGGMTARFYMYPNSTFATLYYPVNSSSSNFVTVNADQMNAANASNIWTSGTYFTAS